MSVISQINAEHYLWGDSCHGWHLVKSKHLSVIQELVPSGCEETRHFHNNSEQFFYILSGVATMKLAEEVFTLSAMEGIHVVAKAKHQLSNRHDQDLVFTVTSTPPSHGDRVNCE